VESLHILLRMISHFTSLCSRQKSFFVIVTQRDGNRERDNICGIGVESGLVNVALRLIDETVLQRMFFYKGSEVSEFVVHFKGMPLTNPSRGLSRTAFSPRRARSARDPIHSPLRSQLCVPGDGRDDGSRRRAPVSGTNNVNKSHLPPYRGCGVPGAVPVPVQAERRRGRNDASA